MTKEERTEQKHLENKQKARSVMESEASPSKAMFLLSSNTDDDRVVQVAVGGSLPKQARGNQNLITSALGRTQISDRKATTMIIKMVRSLGHEPAEFNMNRTSI